MSKLKDATMIDATEEHEYGYRDGTYTRSEIKRVDNRTELD